jgi:hypothetical protein
MDRFSLGRILEEIMGARPYKQLTEIDLNCNENNIVVEIGSENGEGSSLWLHTWAQEHSIKFYSVDVEHRMRERTYPEINWAVAESGSIWCKNILPGLNKTIKVLYLDNFDWIWDSNNVAPYCQTQIEKYAARGVIMNNQNSQEEHRLQLEYCLPYLDEQSVVIMDDTFYNNGIWDGKCATAIPLLLEHGFKIYGSDLATRGIK